MSHGHMQINDAGNGHAIAGMAMNHMDHFENVLNLNMTNDYHYGMEYWSGPYKNGSTPMKEMEGESQLMQSNWHASRLRMS